MPRASLEVCHVGGEVFMRIHAVKDGTMRPLRGKLEAIQQQDDTT